MCQRQNPELGLSLCKPGTLEMKRPTELISSNPLIFQIGNRGSEKWGQTKNNAVIGGTTWELAPRFYGHQVICFTSLERPQTDPQWGQCDSQTYFIWTKSGFKKLKLVALKNEKTLPRKLKYLHEHNQLKFQCFLPLLYRIHTLWFATVTPTP